MAAFLDAPERFVQFVALDARGDAVGLAEASVRHDYVNGTTGSPVAFLEGIYVAPGARRQGVAAQLVAAVGTWAREQGCGELASDADVANEVSHAMHRALGFEETERVVFFRKGL
jgi:aminoglycoside 6'-N-acetyltransferase I